MTLDEDAQEILASRSHAQAVETLARVLQDTRKEARLEAARDLDKLHAELAATSLRGRVLGTVSECARYLRTGSTGWLMAAARQQDAHPRKRSSVDCPTHEAFSDKTDGPHGRGCYCDRMG